MNRAVVIDENMILSSKINNILKNQGLETKVISFAKSNLVDKLKEFNAELVIINLESRANNSLEIIKNIKENLPEAKIVGYAGHANINLMENAKNLGADLVVSNGVVVSQLPQIINSLK